MKKFTYALQNMLDLREFYQKNAETELAKALSESERIKSALHKNAEQRTSASFSRSNVHQITDLTVIEQFINRLDKEKEDLLEQAARAELVVEEKRAILTEKMKEAKALSKLKERQYGEYRKNIQQIEDSVLDDIVNSKR